MKSGGEQETACTHTHSEQDDEKAELNVDESHWFRHRVGMRAFRSGAMCFSLVKLLL